MSPLSPLVFDPNSTDNGPTPGNADDDSERLGVSPDVREGAAAGFSRPTSLITDMPILDMRDDEDEEDNEEDEEDEEEEDEEEDEEEPLIPELESELAAVAPASRTAASEKVSKASRSPWC